MLTSLDELLCFRQRQGDVHMFKVASLSNSYKFICSCNEYDWLTIFLIYFSIEIATFEVFLDWDLIIASLSDLFGGAFWFFGNKEQAVFSALAFLKYHPQSFQSQQSRSLDLASHL